MEIKQLPQKLLSIAGKYRYALIVLVVGLVLLLLPQGKEKSNEASSQSLQPETTQQERKTEALAKILQSVRGAGRVEVLLSLAAGEETVYQVNTETTATSENSSTKIETVLITDSQREESGLVRQIKAPVYLGAIVVCQGGDDPAVKLAITQAVAKITGLGADAICVLKMK